jgi:hypothetical protein
MAVVFITALGNPETREEAKKVGTGGCFRRPVDYQALLYPTRSWENRVMIAPYMQGDERCEESRKPHRVEQVNMRHPELE